MVPRLLFLTQPVIPALVQRSRVSFVRFKPADYTNILSYNYFVYRLLHTRNKAKDIKCRATVQDVFLARDVSECSGRRAWGLTKLN